MKVNEPIIPERWKPNCPKSIERWFNKLPNVYNIETVKEIDKKYELLRLKLWQV